ncbi:transporter [Capnocytophaga canis]|uniref:transporter n=1 Tax=Capnocytophaga canis TaxID=1848903 RepID=UPI001561CC7C|nr:transporter [Capnocytophaga canis]GIM62043.1 hypothetical protein CAPN008_20930 [Capnocytophaga canis]
MRKIIILLIINTLPIIARGQYTDIINSNQPGNSQSAYAVGRKVLQFEGGLWFEQRNHKYTYTDMTLVGLNYSARYGVLSDKFEAVLNGTLAYDHTHYHYLGSQRSNNIGFINNTIGAKYLIYNPYFDEKPNLYSWKANNKFQWKRLIPAVGVYAGMNFFPNKRFYYDNIPTLSPKAVVSLQSHPMPRVVLVANLIANRFLDSNRELGYIATLTHNIDNGRFSIFLESEGIQSHYYSDHILRLGGAYLFTKDIQVNVDLGASWKDTPSRYMGLVGFSYRIDKHLDVIKKEILKGNEEEFKPTKIKRKKKWLLF